MNRIHFFCLIILFQIGSKSFAHPLEGSWHFYKISCAQHPDEPKVLKPIPGSDFKPDITLTFTKYEDIQNLENKNPPPFTNFEFRKSLSTKSCNNAFFDQVNKDRELKKLGSETLFIQTYSQTAKPIMGDEKKGTLTGWQLGSTWMNPSINPDDCEPNFSTFKGLYISYVHTIEEYSRIYSYFIYQRQSNEKDSTKTFMTLSYQVSSRDQFTSPCAPGEENILDFEKIK